MEKIGIMTWYKYLNYGTALQSSALYRVVKSMGYDAELINYVPYTRYIGDEKFHMLKTISKIINKKILFGSGKRTSEILFNDYLNKRISESKKVLTYSELGTLSSDYDAIVCGSDQIWSPLCFDDNYYLPFVPTDKKIAYAPSIGSFTIENKSIENTISELVSSFKHLSIREEQGAKIIKDISGKEAKIVLDPTLLLNINEWREYSSSNLTKKINKPYILCYSLEPTNKYKKFVKKISNHLDLDVFYLSTKTSIESYYKQVPFDVGPSEFVSLIDNAEYICTDSYHGMIFSIIFNKPFSIFKRFDDNDPMNQNSRVLDLLKLLKLENRLFTCNSKIDDILEIDYTYANNVIGKKREESLHYLENSLCSATNSNSINDDFCRYCSGCGACVTECNNDAITVEMNESGFYHYSIDETKCIKCMKCMSVCPNVNITAPSIIKSKALFSFKANDVDILKKSSSGGTGFLLAKMLNEDGYNIYGCEYDIDSNSAKHIRIGKYHPEELNRIQGSKYIQSNTKDIMKEIAICNDKIAFFGTPCQVAAVDKILSKKVNRNDYILIDLICHGVPSIYLLKKYIEECDDRYNTGLFPNVIFRDKNYPWRKLFITVTNHNQNNEPVFSSDEKHSNFYKFFTSNLCMMESCYNCPYREHSAADIRMGDYWGSKFENDATGVSMVIINTEKGANIFESLDNCLKLEQPLIDYWDVQFPSNPPIPLFYDELIRNLKNDNMPLSETRKKYIKNSLSMKFYKKMTKIYHRIFK